MLKPIFFCLALFCAFAVSAQTVVTKTADGNYIETVVPKDSAYYARNAEPSAAKFTAKDGKKYQVFLSPAKGDKPARMFYIKKSDKTGKWSRRYFETTATE